MTDVKNFALNSTPELESQIASFSHSKAYHNSTIRVMPDGHVGKSAAIGSVITFNDKIVPATVGVDIACRISIFNLGININDIDLNDFLPKFDVIVNERVPTGFNVRNKEAEFSKTFPYKNLCCYSALKNVDRLRKSMGTLGGGKHYIELDVDDITGAIYLVVHCGSRNLGKQIAEFYQKIAVDAKNIRLHSLIQERDDNIKKLKEVGEFNKIQPLIEEYKIKIKEADIPNDLCYITGVALDAYLDDMKLCNDWSQLNHSTIFWEIAEGLAEVGY